MNYVRHRKLPFDKTPRFMTCIVEGKFLRRLNALTDFVRSFDLPIIQPNKFGQGMSMSSALISDLAMQRTVTVIDGSNFNELPYKWYVFLLVTFWLEWGSMTDHFGWEILNGRPLCSIIALQGKWHCEIVIGDSKPASSCFIFVICRKLRMALCTMPLIAF